MKGFFKDYETKRFTHDEQLEWIFKQLVTVLNPIVTGENSISYITMNSHGKLVNKREKFKLLFINPENIKVAKLIEIPFRGIHLTVNKKQIRISGDWFSYTFPPDQIFLIQSRMKKRII